MRELIKLFSLIPYFSFESEQVQQTFYHASSYEPTPREKDKNSRGQKTSYQFFLFSCRS